MKHNIALAWSGGKDAALTYQFLLERDDLSVERLFTTVNRASQKVTMHSVPVHLLRQQASSMQLPLDELVVNEGDFQDYEDRLLEYYRRLQKEGITAIAYGDIFLEDLKNYKQKQIEKTGLTAVFPLWKEDTRLLMQKFLDGGMAALICTLDAGKMDYDFLGKSLSGELLQSLPEHVDPCGENGEFHTFVHTAPFFKRSIRLPDSTAQYVEYPHPAKEEEKMGFWNLVWK